MVKRAVLIGINYNSLPALKLRGCINDIILMRSMLIDAYGYQQKDITMLRDDGQKYDLPTRENIIQSLQKVCDMTIETDELWIHYSGHGTYVRDTNNEELDGYDEVIVPLDHEENGTLLDEELKAILKKATGTVIITQDCCNSGTGWDLPYRFVNDNNNSVIANRESDTMLNKNIYMLSGARDNQLASDSYDSDLVLNVGAFTNALIECLRSGGHNNKFVDLKTKINTFLETNKYTQRVEFTSSNSTPNNVVLTRSGVTNVDPPLIRKEIVRPKWLMFL